MPQLSKGYTDEQIDAVSAFFAHKSEVRGAIMSFEFTRRDFIKLMGAGAAAGIAGCATEPEGPPSRLEPSLSWRRLWRGDGRQIHPHVERREDPGVPHRAERHLRLLPSLESRARRLA